MDEALICQSEVSFKLISTILGIQKLYITIIYVYIVWI